MLSKKVTKSKIRSKSFNLTKKWFHSAKILNQSSVFLFLFLFFSHIKFRALIILHLVTVKLNVTKSYILVDVMGVLALV